MSERDPITGPMEPDRSHESPYSESADERADRERSERTYSANARSLRHSLKKSHRWNELPYWERSIIDEQADRTPH